MFTLTDSPVKFVGLLILFAFTTLWSLRDLGQPQTIRQRISNSLHLLMAVVMLAMVAQSVWTPVSAVIPLPVWVAVFALATGWYGYLIGHALHARSAGRPAALGHAISHTLMFAAMTWHLAAMDVMHRNMAGHHGVGPDGHGGAHDGHGQHGMSMTEAGTAMWWFAVIGVPFMLYLLGGAVAALVAAFAPARATEVSKVAVTVREPVPSERAGTSGSVPDSSGGRAVGREELPPAASATCHEPRPVGSAAYRLGQLSHFAMLFGMFWMSTGLLTPLVPFMSAL